MRKLQKIIALFLVSSMLFLQIPIAQARLISTDQALQHEQQTWTRANVSQLLDKTEIRAQLIKLGVDPAQAKDRVNRMTDQEVATLNQQLANQPAGGMDILGVLVVVFIVLVITDLLGATDVFPWVHDINHH
jgi:hypothetical protein